ncbi:hypothetical protein [Microvirga sp. M2]|uniref:hypothetical protein n=1 Tax=Microvirga sp. M2 TaxID=3073270 RepID=UPI0039C0935B
MSSTSGRSGGIALAAAARLGSLVLGIGFQILVAKAMMTGEYASYSVALAISVVVGTLSGLGIARSLSRFLPLVIAYGSGSDLVRTLAFYLCLKAIGLGIIIGGLLQFGVLDIPTLWSGHPLDQGILITWILILSLQLDIEAVAQALKAYRAWAVTAFLEVASRACICLSIAGFGRLHPNDLMFIWGATSATQILIVILILCAKNKNSVRPDFNPADRSLIPSFGQQLKFSISIYMSALSWLAASPFSVRLMSATALPPAPLAAISFAQALATSALRGLPVHLLSPIVEPLLVGKIIVNGDRPAAEMTLSVLIKLETIIVMGAIVVAAPLGPLLITALGKPDFAPYGFILPILLVQSLGTSYFRAAEILGSILQVHVTFVAMLPISLLSLVLVYLTSSSLGPAALLIWPCADTAAKLAIMIYALRARGAARIFDVARLNVVIAPAIILILTTEALIWRFGLDSLGRICLSLLAGVTFMLTLLLSRPFRRQEHQLIDGFSPRNNVRVGNMVGLLAK